MGYKKAEDILPAELIEILQEYVDVVNLFYYLIYLMSI